MEDFNWKFQEENERYICEVEGATLVLIFSQSFMWYWEVYAGKEATLKKFGSTNLSLDYAQGQAEGAYLGLKATGKL